MVCRSRAGRFAACAFVVLSLICLVAANRSRESSGAIHIASVGAPALADSAQIDPRPAEAALDAALRAQAAAEAARQAAHVPTTAPRSTPPPTSRPRVLRPGEPPYGHYDGLVGAVPCGGHTLPSCHRVWVESGGDVAVWNGGCHAPVGYRGPPPCGGRHSTASGAYQILSSTWNGYGGFLNAADAPLDVQVAKARTLGCGAWQDCPWP